MMMTQAPRPNFAIANTTATIAVAVAPSPLMTALRRQPGPRSKSQWRTIPRRLSHSVGAATVNVSVGATNRKS